MESLLSDLARVRPYRTKRASSWDRTGGNRDRLSVAPGETVTATYAFNKGPKNGGPPATVSGDFAFTGDTTAGAGVGVRIGEVFAATGAQSDAGEVSFVGVVALS